MNANGNNPAKKNIIPDVIIEYVNPLNIINSKCPAIIFAPSLNPNDMFLAKYDTNSINTNKGTNPKGQPNLS